MNKGLFLLHKQTHTAMLLEKMIDLQNIAKDCETNSGIFDFSNSNIQHIWKNAFMYRKRLINALPFETVKSFEFFSENTQTLVNYKLTPETGLSRLQIFILIYMNESFCSLEATEKMIEKYC